MPSQKFLNFLCFFEHCIVLNGEIKFTSVRNCSIGGDSSKKVAIGSLDTLNKADPHYDESFLLLQREMAKKFPQHVMSELLAPYIDEIHEDFIPMFGTTNEERIDQIEKLIAICTIPNILADFLTPL